MVYICRVCKIEYVRGSPKKEWGNVHYDFCAKCQEIMWAEFRAQFRIAIGRRSLRIEAKPKNP